MIAVGDKLRNRRCDSSEIAAWMLSLTFRRDPITESDLFVLFGLP